MSKRNLVMAGKAKGKKVDGRSLRYVDQEVLWLFREVLNMYGAVGAKLILRAIIEEKVKPKF